jgi:hypothetical protein
MTKSICMKSLKKMQTNTLIWITLNTPKPNWSINVSILEIGERKIHTQNKEEARYEVNLPSTFVIKKRVLKVMYKYKIPRRTSIGLKSKKESQ